MLGHMQMVVSCTEVFLDRLHHLGPEIEHCNHLLKEKYFSEILPDVDIKKAFVPCIAWKTCPGMYKKIHGGGQ